MKSVIQPVDQMLGKPSNAPSIIFYGDYPCPISRELHFTVSQLLVHFEGKVQYAYCPFPQPHKYPYALLAARAVEAAGQQGHYWPMHNALFRYKGSLNLDSLYDIAYHTGLDNERFHFDLGNQALLEPILLQVQESRRLGVQSAPALFINGERQTNTALWYLRERLERWLTALPGGRVVGTVDPLLGTIYWGLGTGL